MSLFACPICRGEKTTVTDSRPTEAAIRRRRRCGKCRNRFTTYEVMDISGGGNFALQLDGLAARASAILAQSQTMLRETENLQRLSAAWREIEEGRRGS